MKVDVWVTTTYAYATMLMTLLESISMFWPLQEWRSEAIVVLAAEKEADRALCRRVETMWSGGPGAVRMAWGSGPPEAQ